jgi:hypothetical protein
MSSQGQFMSPRPRSFDCKAGSQFHHGRSVRFNFHERRRRPALFLNVRTRQISA